MLDSCQVVASPLYNKCGVSHGLQQCPLVSLADTTRQQIPLQIPLASALVTRNTQLRYIVTVTLYDCVT